jgi:hypothetical protein
MIQDRNICRFCLSSRIGTENPLISPCNCKGSLEFVHLKCLNRWRQIDMQRNGRTCALCLTNYTLWQAIQIEVIPGTNSIVLYCLEYPGLLLLFYNYIYSIALASSRNPNYDFLQEYYIFSQYVFHFVYAFFFYTEWSVANRGLYWKQVKTLWTPTLLGMHIYMFVLLKENAYFLGPLLSFYMGLYWACHKRLLRNINVHLAEIQDQ